MTGKLIQNNAKATLKLADALSEVWVGTTTGRVIDYKKKLVKELLGKKEYNLAGIAVLELAETCRDAQKESHEYTTG